MSKKVDQKEINVEKIKKSKDNDKNEKKSNTIAKFLKEIEKLENGDQLISDFTESLKVYNEINGPKNIKISVEGCPEEIDSDPSEEIISEITKKISENIQDEEECKDRYVGVIEDIPVPTFVKSIVEEVEMHLEVYNAEELTVNDVREILDMIPEGSCINEISIDDIADEVKVSYTTETMINDPEDEECW